MRKFTGKALAGSSLTAVSLALFSTPAFAQQQPQTDSDDCALIQNAEEREECLEAASEGTDAGAQQGQADTLPPGVAPSEAVSEDAIVITGSRLRRDNFNSPDPIQVISPEQSLAEGDVETAEILQQSPLAAGSTQITSVLSTNFVTNGGPGAQTLSLRGLGAQRTLVLLNGRRAGPAGVRGAIASFDLNVIPSAAISSVEILKTGSSSVYGSDAIAGVVNLITNTEFDGIDIRAFGSIPQESGGETYNVSALFGKTFDRGHIQIGADYFKREELERGDRDFIQCEEDFIFGDPDRTQRVDQIDPRTGQPQCGNTFGPVVRLTDRPYQFGFNPTSPLRDPISGDIQFNDPNDRFDEFLQPVAGQDGFYEVNLFGVPVRPGTPGFDLDYAIASEGLVNVNSDRTDTSTLSPLTERYTLFADGAFELTPGAEIFVEGLYNKRETSSQAERQLFFNQFSRDAIITSQLFGFAAGGDPVTSIQGDFQVLPVIPFIYESSQEVDYYRGVAGLRGDFVDFGADGILEDAFYEVSYQYSRSDGEYRFDQIAQDAIDYYEFRQQTCAQAAADPTNTTINSDGTTTYFGSQCVDIDFTDSRVLNGNFTQAEEDVLFWEAVGNTEYTQHAAEAFVGTNLFDLPGGSVPIVLGLQFRQDEIDDQPDAATTAGQGFGFSSATRTAGKFQTLEAFGEVELPLIANEPYFEYLAVTASGRVTNNEATRIDGVSQSENGNFTYRLAGNWAITPEFRLRGGFGTSYRAPSLYEFFLGDQSGFGFPADPCEDYGNPETDPVVADRCAAEGVDPDFVYASSAEIFSTGGLELGLDSETSDAWNISAVFTPDVWFWEGGRFSAAVDYINITVENQIAQLGAAFIVGQCYTPDREANNRFCDQFTRAPSTGDPSLLGQLEFVDNPYVNIATQENKAIDLNLRFSQDLGGDDRLLLSSQLTWQRFDQIQVFEDEEPDDNNGENGDPIFIGDISASYSTGPFLISYGMDIIGGTSDFEDLIDAGYDENGCTPNAQRGGLVCPVFRLEPQFYHSLSGRYDINNNFQLTLGVSNIFDTEPPRASSVFTPIAVLGNAPTNGSYYDYLGRRFFGQIRVRY